MTEPGIVTEYQVVRLNQLAADMVREGSAISSVAGSLMGTSIELLMRAGATDDDIRHWCSQLFEAVFPIIREAMATNATLDEIDDMIERFEPQRSSS